MKIAKTLLIAGLGAVALLGSGAAIASTTPNVKIITVKIATQKGKGTYPYWEFSKINVDGAHQVGGNINDYLTHTMPVGGQIVGVYQVDNATPDENAVTFYYKASPGSTENQCDPMGIRTNSPISSQPSCPGVGIAARANEAITYNGSFENVTIYLPGGGPEAA